MARIDNIARSAPNCHGQAHSHWELNVNLTPSRLKAIRDRWYAYYENGKDASTISERFTAPQEPCECTRVRMSFYAQ